MKSSTLLYKIAALFLAHLKVAELSFKVSVTWVKKSLRYGSEQQ